VIYYRRYVDVIIGHDQQNIDDRSCCEPVSAHSTVYLVVGPPNIPSEVILGKLDPISGLFFGSFLILIRIVSTYFTFLEFYPDLGYCNSFKKYKNRFYLNYC
jgi:hypothetical protein